jgi:hypothetical protein
MLLGASLSPGSRAAAAPFLLSPDGTGKTYEAVAAAGYRLETPDCKHNVRHIAEEMDPDLKKDVFVFAIHRDLDDDRCQNTDRQRLEICTNNSSPAALKGLSGMTHTYRWKFKLDAGFKPSGSFCHIHQIKAEGGSDDDAPIVTITPREGSPEQLEIMNIGDNGNGGTVAHTALAQFKGVWVEAYEKVRYGDAGSYSIVIHRVSDRAVLLSYSDDKLDMWRSGSTMNRPKYGIYRSLNDKSQLRDETVRFADFCLAAGTDDCEVPDATLLPRKSVRPARTGMPAVLRWFDASGRTVEAIAPAQAVLPGFETGTAGLIYGN